WRHDSGKSRRETGEWPRWEPLSIPDRSCVSCAPRGWDLEPIAFNSGEDQTSSFKVLELFFHKKPGYAHDRFFQQQAVAGVREEFPYASLVAVLLVIVW